MNVRNNASSILGNVEFSNDKNNSHEFNHGKGASQISDASKYGHIEHAPKVPVCNERNDFTIGAQQLQNNPYFQSIQ